MDVTCERCSTAYEFDDALVSERGTTVKCTSCGHQFKVRRPQPLGAPERWLVRTIDGRELEFRALRELQAAIAQATITRDDVLSRGGARPRRLGSIAELEPFFASVTGGGNAHSTSLGLGPRAPIITGYPGHDSRPRASTPSSLGLAMPQQGSRTSEGSVAIPLPRGPTPLPEAPASAPSAPARRPISAPPPPRRSQAPEPISSAVPTLPGVVIGPGGAPPLPPTEPSLAAEDAFYTDATRVEPRNADFRSEEVTAQVDPARARAFIQEDWTPSPADLPLRDAAIADARARHEAVPPSPSSGDARVRSRPPPAAVADELPPPVDSSETAVASRRRGPDSESGGASTTPTPGIGRLSYDDALIEPRFSQAGARRGGAARWIVGTVVLGMAALAFATVGRKMLAAHGTVEPDARVVELLGRGEKSLVEGDLETAKEQFDKASVLGEREPRTVADLARLAAVRADVEWLRVRLLAENDPEQPAARRELELDAQRAQKLAEQAAGLAPADPSVVRSRIDALRLAGDLGSARRLVAGISAASAQPDNALTLAALDMAEPKPDWTTVIDRLRTALSTDGSLGRARTMLVYALARSGDAGGARAELDRLAALTRPRPHPLVGALRAYLARSGSVLDPNALPDASAKPAGGKPPPPAPGPTTAAPAPREPREPREQHEPRPVEPRTPSPPPEDRPLAPSGPVDVSDLPGAKAPAPVPVAPSSQPSSSPQSPPAHTAAPALPPGVDTSDLPVIK